MKKILAILLILIVALNVVLMVTGTEKEGAKAGEKMLSKSLKVEVKDVSTLFFSNLLKF